MNSDEAIRIKKYGNRRFYCSNQKSYINLSEIEQYILTGQKVLVVDADTDEEITSEVLTQILLERKKAHHLPVEMLENLIKMNETSLKTLWTPMIEQNIKMFNQMSELAMQGMKMWLPQKRKSTNESDSTSNSKKSKSSISTKV